MCWLSITKVNSYQSMLCVIGHNTSIMLWVLPGKTISASYFRLIQILYQKLNNYNWISKLKLIFLHFEDKWLFRLSPFRFLKASNLLKNQKCYKSWNSTNTSRDYSIRMRWKRVNWQMVNWTGHFRSRGFVKALIIGLIFNTTQCALRQSLRQIQTEVMVIS